MGVSTDGLLFYGVTIDSAEGSYNVLSRLRRGGDEGDDDEEDEEVLAAAYGYVEPASGSDALWEAYQADRDSAEKLEAWRTARRAEQALKDSLVPVEVIQYCSNEYPMHALAVKGGSYSVARGSVERLGQSLVADPEWREVLRDACERLGIPFEEPEWLLASYWG